MGEKVKGYGLFKGLNSKNNQPIKGCGGCLGVALLLFVVFGIVAYIFDDGIPDETEAFVMAQMM